MSKIKRLIGATGIGGSIIGVIVIIGGLLVITPLCWDYAISTWLIHFGKPDNFKLWMAFVLSIVPGVGQAGIIVAAVTYIAMMFI